MNGRSGATHLKVLPVIAGILVCFAVGPNVFAQESKPHSGLSVVVKAWNEAGGDLGSGFVGVIDQGEIRSSRVGFIFAPRQGELRGSWGYEDFHAGTYLLYLDWEPPRGRKSGGFAVSLLNDHFMTHWITVEKGEDKFVELKLMEPGTGQLSVSPSPSPRHRSAWLLPFGAIGEEPPDITAEQQWQLAFELNVERSSDQKEAKFENLPFGSYRVFLVEHKQGIDEIRKIDSCRVLNSANVNVGKREQPTVEFGAKIDR